jgi:hypothetical protein
VAIAYLEQGPYLYNLPSNLDPADLEDPEIRALLKNQEKELKALLVKKGVIPDIDANLDKIFGPLGFKKKTDS